MIPRGALTMKVCHKKGSNYQCLSGTGVHSIVQVLERSTIIPVWKGALSCLERVFKDTFAKNWSTINKICANDAENDVNEVCCMRRMKSALQL